MNEGDEDDLIMGGSRPHGTYIDDLLEGIGFKLKIKLNKSIWDKLLNRDGDVKRTWNYGPLYMDSYTKEWFKPRYINKKIVDYISLGVIFNEYIENEDGVKNLIKQYIREIKLDRITDENKNRFRKQ